MRSLSFIFARKPAISGNNCAAAGRAKDCGREAVELGWMNSMDDLWYHPEWPEWEPRFAPPGEADIARMRSLRASVPAAIFAAA